MNIEPTTSPNKEELNALSIEPAMARCPPRSQTTIRPDSIKSNSHIPHNGVPFKIGVGKIETNYVDQVPPHVIASKGIN